MLNDFERAVIEFSISLFNKKATKSMNLLHYCRIGGERTIITFFVYRTLTEHDFSIGTTMLPVQI